MRVLCNFFMIVAIVFCLFLLEVMAEHVGALGPMFVTLPGYYNDGHFLEPLLLAFLCLGIYGLLGWYRDTQV